MTKTITETVRPVMVRITRTIAVPSANITMVQIEEHPDCSKAPTWLGHVTLVNPVNGNIDRVDLVFEDEDIADKWQTNLLASVNMTEYTTVRVEEC